MFLHLLSVSKNNHFGEKQIKVIWKTHTHKYFEAKSIKKVVKLGTKKFQKIFQILIFFMLKRKYHTNPRPLVNVIFEWPHPKSL